MSISFSGLAHISPSRRPQSLVDAAQYEKTGRQTLLDTMQPLATYDSSITTFDGCCGFVNAFDPDGEDDAVHDVEAFEGQRLEYLKQVVTYSRSWFYTDENAEQKLFELSQKNLRAIDPSIIGESRYDAEDGLIVKIYKTVCHFLLRQVYMWCFPETVRTWAARHDILKWAANQDPRCLTRPPLHYSSLSRQEEEGKDIRDIVIDRVCLPQLGFEEDERKKLQGLFRIFPGEIKSFEYSQKTKKFRLVFKDSWKLTLDWKKISERFHKLPEKIGFNGIHLDLYDVSIQTQKVIEGHVVHEDERSYFEFDPGSVRATLPATFNAAHIDILVDALQWGRRDDGSMTFKIDVSTSSNWFVDQAVKVIVAAGSTLLFKQATSSPILPPESKSIPAFNSEMLHKIKDIPNWNKV